MNEFVLHGAYSLFNQDTVRLQFDDIDNKNNGQTLLAPEYLIQKKEINSIQAYRTVSIEQLLFSNLSKTELCEKVLVINASLNVFSITELTSEVNSFNAKIISGQLFLNLDGLSSESIASVLFDIKELNNEDAYKELDRIIDTPVSAP